MNVFVSDGVRLAYRVDGSHDVPAIVLVNSLGTDLRMWGPQIALGKVIQVQNQETLSGMRGIPEFSPVAARDYTAIQQTQVIQTSLLAH